MANIDRKTYRYEPKKSQADQVISSWLLAKTALYPRYGFDKLFNLMRLSGYTYNHKRVRRIYCELRLNIKIKPKKRLAPRTKVKLVPPMNSNESWSLDYMSDALICGRRVRTANIIDDFNREGIGILVSHTLPSQKITRWIDRLALTKGYPKQIRVDNGPENISKDFMNWAARNQIKVLHIQPGKPAQNAYIERFNRSYREAVLDMYLFHDIHEIQKITDQWLKHYNNERPHQALNNMTPYQYTQQHENLYF